MLTEDLRGLLSTKKNVLTIGVRGNSVFYMGLRVGFF